MTDATEPAGDPAVAVPLVEDEDPGAFTATGDAPPPGTDAAASSSQQLVELSGETLLLLTEYLPFGANNLALLEDRLECTESLREIHLTDETDADPERGVLEIEEPEAKVAVTGYRRHSWIDFVAEVRYRTRGKLEVERLGTTVTRLGGVTYSLFLDRSGATARRHALDALARVVADIEADTTVLIDTLLSAFQRRLIRLIFSDRGDAHDKYAVLIASGMTPERADVGAYHREIPLRAELKQVLMQFRAEDCFELDDGTRVFRGKAAAIVLTDDAERYENVFRFIATLESIAAFLDATLSRMWQTWDRLAEVKRRIRTEGTEALRFIQEALSQIAADLNLFESVIGLVRESLQQCRDVYTKLRADSEPIVVGLLDRFEIERRITDLVLRIDDVGHVVTGLEKELGSARELASSLADKDLHEVNRVMTILTVVSTIMLPLTVIAGIYGMNFDPGVSGWNMPELRWVYGYPVVLGLMAFITIGLLVVFRRRKLI